MTARAGQSSEAVYIDSARQLLELLAKAPVLSGGRIDSVVDWPDEELEASFVECRFEDCVFTSALLEGVEFRDCEFLRCSFRRAQLRDVQFIDCKLYVTEEACDFAYAELRDASFSGCDLTTVSFERANAYGLRLSRCQGQGADFSGVDFGMMLSRNSTIVSFECADCNLAYADFSNTYLNSARFTDTRLAHAVLQRCDLSDAVLTGCELDNIESGELLLAGTDLRGTQFNNLDPRVVNLTGAQVDSTQALTLLATMGIDVILTD